MKPLLHGTWKQPYSITKSLISKAVLSFRPVPDNSLELLSQPKFENRDSSFDDTGSVMSVSEKKEVVAAFIKQVQIFFLAYCV